MAFNVMIQVSDPADVKDPSAAYTECVDMLYIEQAIACCERMMRSAAGGIFTRWFIRHADGTESHHGEK